MDDKLARPRFFRQGTRTPQHNYFSRRLLGRSCCASKDEPKILGYRKSIHRAVPFCPARNNSSGGSSISISSTGISRTGISRATRTLLETQCDDCMHVPAQPIDGSDGAERALRTLTALKKFSVVLITEWLSDERSKLLLDRGLDRLPGLSRLWNETAAKSETRLLRENDRSSSSSRADGSGGDTEAAQLLVADVPGVRPSPGPRRSGDAPASIVTELLLLNAADIALYEKARSLVWSRMQKLPVPGGGV